MTKSKNYLYISPEKVEMLLGSGNEKISSRIAAKLRVGAPSLVGIEATVGPAADGRTERVERLCRALTAQGRVGGPTDTGSEFFRAEMMMTWGFWNRANGRYADVVGFGGFAAENVSVFLGGSAYNAVERSSTERLQQYSNSGLQQLMQFLRERHASSTDGKTTLPGAWYAETWDADHDNPLEPERVEYVAVRLADTTPDQYGVRCILGSPIYVARARALPSKEDLDRYVLLRERMLESLHRSNRREKMERGERWQIGKFSDASLIPELPPWTPPT